MSLLGQAHFKSNFPPPNSITKEKNPVWFQILSGDRHKQGVALHFKRSNAKWNKKLEAHAGAGENGGTVSGALASLWRDTEHPGQNELCLRGAKCMSWSEDYFREEVTASYAGTMQSAYFYSESESISLTMNYSK